MAFGLCCLDSTGRSTYSRSAKDAEESAATAPERTLSLLADVSCDRSGFPRPTACRSSWLHGSRVPFARSFTRPSSRTRLAARRRSLRSTSLVADGWTRLPSGRSSWGTVTTMSSLAPTGGRNSSIVVGQSSGIIDIEAHPVLAGDLARRHSRLDLLDRTHELGLLEPGPLHISPPKGEFRSLAWTTFWEDVRVDVSWSAAACHATSWCARRSRDSPRPTLPCLNWTWFMVTVGRSLSVRSPWHPGDSRATPNRTPQPHGAGPRRKYVAPR
jgi:hypothetical protein